MIELRQFIDSKGRNPFERWFLSLTDDTQARIATVLARVENGNFSMAKSLRGGLYELRMDFGPGYRVYYGKDGDRLVILLGGGSKHRQDADIKTAHVLWAEYKKEKRGN